MKAPVLMIQGTASSVGKSLIVAGFCRALLRRGISVAPFKSQNMSLNAAVTQEGHEIGRAQAFQAMAAGIEPSFDMNPILLKPESDRQAQVIVHGKVRARVQAADGYQETLGLRQAVTESLDRLRSRFEFVVIEGAGSPAEINLQARDIVNMFVAKLARAPVILVGDIDRGGVFAAIYGTIKLLRPGEADHIIGILINKFRGDRSLLSSGLRDLERLVERPVLGVVPFLHDLGLPEEDSLSFDEKRRTQRRRSQTHLGIEVGVVRLPRLSNSDDFEPLERDSRFHVKYVDRAEQVVACDLVVLPGSKSTIADLRWLRERGIARAICKFAESGGKVIGVCGGCQMLGQSISDPDGVESNIASEIGLGLLPINTRFRAEKKTMRVRARSVSSRMGEFNGCWFGSLDTLDGYEIHSGEIERDCGNAAVFRIIERNGYPCDVQEGATNQIGNVVGTMMHGLFANQSLRRSLVFGLNYFLEQRPVQSRTCSGEQVQCGTEEQTGLDRLADVLEQELDIEDIISTALRWGDCETKFSPNISTAP